MTQSASDLTKKEINENTTVTHISRNDYRYSYETPDNRFFEKDGLNHDVYMKEDYPSEFVMHIGNATTKKEFVNLVYSALH